MATLVNGEKTVTDVRRYGLMIGAESVETGVFDPVHLPYDGTTIAHVTRAGEREFDRAVASARIGAEAMSKLPNFERADLLLRFADAVRADGANLAHLVMSETGKPIKEAELEARRSVDTLVAAAHAARELHGEAVPMDFASGGVGRMGMTVREPLGIIGAITPFNFPLNLGLHKIAPAIAGGNAVILKPAERTPLSSLRLAELANDAGAPKGTLNVITGNGPQLAGMMLRSQEIAMITFTGSVCIGTEIRSKAGLKRVTLELGNNSAVIVEPDADIDNAVIRSVQGGFTHSGQACISLQRAFVHESVFEKYVDGLVNGARALRIGHPREKTTDISSLIDEAAAKRVESWVSQAVGMGAQIRCGGRRRFATIEPTVLTNVPAEARISCEEVFGPVIAVYRYRDVADAVERANATPYGLQAGIYTRDIQRAFHVARRLRFGGVMINDVPTFRLDHMPYGGVKESGIGREGPRYAVEEMTELKLIAWRV